MFGVDYEHEHEHDFFRAPNSALRIREEEHTVSRYFNLGRMGLIAILLGLLAVGGQAQIVMGGGGGEIKGGRVTLQVGESKLVKDVESFDIANTKVLGATPTPEGDLILKGLAGGTTTVLLRKKGASGVYSYEAEVTGVNSEFAIQTVRAALGSIVGLVIQKQGETISLEGKILNRDDGKRIDRQKKQFGNTLLDLTDRAYMNEDLENLARQFKESNCPFIKADVDMGQDAQKVLILRGSVVSDEQLDTVMGLAQKYFDKDRIINNVSVNRPQVEVDVEVVTFDLKKARQVGSNTLLGQITNFSSTGWSINTGPGGSTTYPTLSFGAFSTNIQALHNAGAVTNQMKQHASVRSGETAHIENVTDQKIKVSGAFDAKLETVKVGQILDITPVVLESGHFSTKVKVSISDLAGAEETTKDAALAVNTASYEGVFSSGTDEVVVLGGGTRITTKQVISKTPILGSIPIINVFFKSKHNENTEGTSVFFMTLRAPTTEAAKGSSFGSNAQAQKEDINTKAEEKRQFLDRKVKPN